MNAGIYFDAGLSAAPEMDIVLYTRQGCHLCEEAQALLMSYGLDPTLVDVDSDSVLRERYNEWVPVVEIDGRERFRGRINEVLLQRLLAQQRDA